MSFDITIVYLPSSTASVNKNSLSRGTSTVSPSSTADVNRNSLGGGRAGSVTETTSNPISTTGTNSPTPTTTNKVGVIRNSKEMNRNAIGETSSSAANSVYNSNNNLTKYSSRTPAGTK